MKKLFPVILFSMVVCLAAFTGCKKDPLYIDLHKDTIITGNKPPQYNGVTNLQIKLYVNKFYVDLIGREPTSTELDAKTNYLIQHNLDSASRAHVIEELLTTTQYYQRFYLVASASMLNSTDSNAIAQELFLLYFLRDSLGGAGTPLFYFDYEINRLEKLIHLSADLKNGTITIREFFRTMIDNYFYDNINMGSENFVKAAFYDLFGRQPTESELKAGVTMSDGQPAILFLQNGGSKYDFQNVVVNTPEFVEGLVRKTYLQFLLRTPTSAEMTAGTKELSNALNLPAFQKKIIITKEYAGF